MGAPPGGLRGPFVSLTDEGDGQWVYSYDSGGNSSTLTLTRYAERRGQGLRWVDPPIVVQLARVLVPTGTFRVAPADVTAAGFDSITLRSTSSWSETGHTPDATDDDAGRYVTWGSIDLSSDYGDPPAGLRGPFVSLTDTSDGEWVYGFDATDAGDVVLTRYAERRGMGLRWVDPPVVVHLAQH